VVTGTRLTINGIAISGKPRLADLERVFGKADRRWDKGGHTNRVHTWDKLGLVVYEPFDGRCVSATFPFKPMTPSFNPTTMFAGSITVDGKPLAATTDYATVKARPGAEARFASSITFDRGDFHVFMTAEPPGHTLDLVELSFWQRGRNDDDDDGGETGDDGGDDDPAPVMREPPAMRPIEDDCRGGDAKKCTSLALAYQTGANVAKRAETAWQYAKLACDGGDAFGCRMLGSMYDAGRGVAVSRPEARRLWQRACTLGDSVGCALAK
jgi:hypothetical protein